MNQEVKGSVSDVREAKLTSGDTNRVVLLETAEGKRIAVDLGPASQLANVEIKKGSPLTVKGDIVSVKTKPVVMARTIGINGQEMQVNRQAPGNQSQAKGQQQPKQFQGQIAQIREVKVKNFEQPHQVALLKTDQNKQIYVDLGPKDQLQDLQLSQGATVKVSGSPMKVKGHAILAASQLQANGKTIQIERQRTGQQTGQQQTM